MAEGGEVFCDRDRKHEPGCQYFDNGGVALETANATGADDANGPTSQTYISAPASNEPIVPDDEPEEIVPDEEPGIPENIQPDSPYESAGQKALTVAEGIAQGVAGPVATAAELGLSKLGVPNVSSPDITAREAANPELHTGAELAGLGASMYIGTGEAALAAKAAKAIAATETIAKMGKVGAAAVKGAVSNGLIQAGDEVSKWLLGQGDPQDAVGARLARSGAAILLSAGVGAGLSGAASPIASKLQSIAEEKAGDKMASFMAGIANAANPGPEGESAVRGAFMAPDAPGADSAAFRAGTKWWSGLKSTLSMGGGLEGAKLGYQAHGILGAAAGYLAASILGKSSQWVDKKITAPVLVNIIQSGVGKGIFESLNHASELAKGNRAIEKGIEGLFNVGGMTGQQAINAYNSDRDRNRLDKCIEEGGCNQQIKDQINEDNSPPGFAAGGEVKEPNEEARLFGPAGGLSAHYPTQDVLLNVAKGRISNYLVGLRPQPNQPRLPFDSPPDQTQQKKSYKRALDIALNPLGILHEVKQGTIEPDHIQHFNAMYPELNTLVQKKLTDRITQAQLAKEKPPLHVRQGLSMLLGTSLSSELLPRNIQAAQATFSQQSGSAPGSGQAPQKSPRGSKSALSKSEQAFLTNSQARTLRSQAVKG